MLSGLVTSRPSLGGDGQESREISKCLPKICFEEKLCADCKQLFIPQRDHGIDAHGSARREIASREGDSGEDDNHSSERDGVRRADAVN